MKRTLKTVASFILLLVTLFSLGMPAFAASKYSATGDMYAAKVIEIKTKKATTLKFEQTKGAFEFANWSLGIAKRNSYGDYYIYVVDQSGKDAPKCYECSFKKTLAIKLKANRTYSVTVCAQSSETTFNRLVRNGTLWNKAPYTNRITWKNFPQWTLSVNQASSFKIVKTVRTPQ